MSDIETGNIKNPLNSASPNSTSVNSGLANNVSANSDSSGVKSVFFLVYVIILIIVMPLIICDIYYATHSECVLHYPDDILVNMKTYLLVCASESLIILVLIAVFIHNMSCDNRETEMYTPIFFIIAFFIQVFTVAWHIVGGVIFWGTLYPEHLCTKQESTYLFVSLIIKLLGCVSLRQSNKKD